MFAWKFRELRAKCNLSFVLDVSNSQLKQSIPSWVISSLRSPRESPSSPSCVVRQSCQPCYFYTRKSWFDLVPVALVCFDSNQVLGWLFFWVLMEISGFWLNKGTLHNKIWISPSVTGFLNRAAVFCPSCPHVLMHLDLFTTFRCR